MNIITFCVLQFYRGELRFISLSLGVITETMKEKDNYERHSQFFYDFSSALDRVFFSFPHIFLHDSSRHERHEKGSGSETETDDLHIPHGHEFHEDLMREGTPNNQASLDELLTE